jgi:sugar phosphate isomerase/epimerase
VLTTPEELSDFILELDSPCFVACVDVGHAAFTGTKPEEFCAKIKNGLLKAVHIQDGDYIGDCHIPPYMGKFNWMAILESLKELEYDGELTFEVFNYLSNYPNDLIFDALCFAERTGRSLISAFERI